MPNQILKNILKAPQVFFVKSTIERKQYHFDEDLSKYALSEYEDIIEQLNLVKKELFKLPKSKHGMRFIHFKDMTYFYAEQLLDIDFDTFISKVDVAHAGDFYRDSLGLTTRVVGSDEKGRPTYQGARIVALAQPNYAAFLGKGELDVYKLEKIEYNTDEHVVWMKTVHSPNKSAACDDGYLSFKRAENNTTCVSFLACQSFPVPPLMALVYLDRWAWLKNTLTESAYHTFFQQMMKNILSCYHGQEFKIGKERAL